MTLEATKNKITFGFKMPNWEKQFDKKFVNSFAGIPCVCKINKDNVEFFLPEDIKQFIKDLLKAERKKEREIGYWQGADHCEKFYKTLNIKKQND